MTEFTEKQLQEALDRHQFSPMFFKDDSFVRYVVKSAMLALIGKGGTIIGFSIRAMRDGENSNGDPVYDVTVEPVRELEK